MPAPRAAAIEAMQSQTLDVLILGGGINGAGALRDLSLRGGLRCGLIEKNHFGSGTSGKNSHLIHGGLRYLKYLDFSLVREALHERAILLKTAPAYVEPLEFILPFRSRMDQLIYRSGLMLYDGLAGDARIEAAHGLSANQLYQREPRLTPGFVAAASYWDGQVASAKLVLANIVDAIGRGALAANYLEMIATERQDGVWVVDCIDRISGGSLRLRAHKLVDATGAWTRETGVRLVRGSHLVVPRLNHSDAAIAYFEESGRIVFFIPWGSQRQCTLVGTTEADHEEGPDQVRISDDEESYLREKIREVYGVDPEPIAAFSSLRPLVLDPEKSATATSREHRIWNDSDDVLRITGGKYTTYRLMSEEAADLVCEQLAPESVDIHLTRTTPIPPPAPDAIEFAALREMAQTLADLMLVSTTWGYEKIWPEAELLDVADKFGVYLGWTPERVRREVDLFESQTRRTAPSLRG